MRQNTRPSRAIFAPSRYLVRPTQTCRRPGETGEGHTHRHDGTGGVLGLSLMVLYRHIRKLALMWHHFLVTTITHTHRPDCAVMLGRTPFPDPGAQKLSPRATGHHQHAPRTLPPSASTKPSAVAPATPPPNQVVLTISSVWASRIWWRQLDDLLLDIPGQVPCPAYKAVLGLAQNPKL